MPTPPRSPSPHAALFEAIFSRPEHAASELQVVLPSDLSAHLDWSSLALRPGSFRDPDLVGIHVDLLFSIHCDGCEAFLYILFEHQSTTGALMPFRLLRYMIRIWEAFLRDQPNAERLPAILPVVLHHSKDGWSAPTAFSEILDLHPSVQGPLAGFVPQFRFLLDDVSAATDAELHRRSVAVAATLFLLRDARQSKHLLADLRRLLGVLRAIADAPGGVAALAALLQYAFQVGDIPKDDLRTFAQQLGPTAVEAFMTTAQQIAEEALAKGRAEGRAELVLLLLNRQFGPLPVHVTERLRGATAQQLELWGERLLSAPSLEDVFR